MRTETKVLIGLAAIFYFWPWKESANVMIDYGTGPEEPRTEPGSYLPNGESRPWYNPEGYTVPPVEPVYNEWLQNYYYGTEGP